MEGGGPVSQPTKAVSILYYHHDSLESRGLVQRFHIVLLTGSVGGWGQVGGGKAEWPVAGLEPREVLVPNRQDELLVLCSVVPPTSEPTAAFHTY